MAGGTTSDPSLHPISRMRLCKQLTDLRFDARFAYDSTIAAGRGRRPQDR